MCCGDAAVCTVPAAQGAFCDGASLPALCLCCSCLKSFIRQGVAGHLTALKHDASQVPAASAELGVPTELYHCDVV